MRAAELMDQLVYDLIDHYEADVLPSGLICLELGMKGHGRLLVEETMLHTQMRVCYLLFTDDGAPVPEPELWFYINSNGQWIPYEMNRITIGHYVFADIDMASGELLLIDPKHQAALATFAEFWAENLRMQGWLEHAYKCSDRSSRPEGATTEQTQPDWDTLMRWLNEDGGCEATDGCWLTEPDGVCEHGHHSWLVALGLL